MALDIPAMPPIVLMVGEGMPWGGESKPSPKQLPALAPYIYTQLGWAGHNPGG